MLIMFLSMLATLLITVFRMFIGVFKRPLLLDFLIIWIVVGGEICYDYYNLNNVFSVAVGLAASILTIFIIVKIKYFGHILLLFFSVYFGYNVYDIVFSIIKDKLPQAGFYISCAAGIAYFIYHTYYGIIHSRKFFGEGMNPFAPIGEMFDKISGKK